MLSKLTLVEKKLQDVHVDHLDPKLHYILVILSSTYSATEVPLQREYNVLEWIILVHNQNKKLITYIESVSELI